MSRYRKLLEAAIIGHAITDEEGMQLVGCDDLGELTVAAANLRDQGFGDRITYSRKVFIPLTQLCRDSCHYCTFAHPPRRGVSAFLTPDEVLATARSGAAAGCREALFTLGDKPELRYRAAARELAELGHTSTISYLAAMAALVLRETGLLPHLNPGVTSRADLETLREVSVSQGIMLETAAERLSKRGGPHFGSPDKIPTARIQTIISAGEASVPLTSGILIGIGETRLERIEALLALRRLHAQYQNLQEIIIQNFRAKPDTRMADHAEPGISEHIWTIAVARILFGASMHIQSPPNLQAGYLKNLIAAGIDDWGGVSPVTPDHVNPERPWPALEMLARQTADGGKVLVERVAAHPEFVIDRNRWIDRKLHPSVLRATDASGLARIEEWRAGEIGVIPKISIVGARPRHILSVVDRATKGHNLTEDEIVTLFDARGPAFHEICQTANALRSDVIGEQVSYVVTRNINYTNVCSFGCKFCAFSKGKMSEKLRGRPYDLTVDEIARRTTEAWERGAVEVCLQGGIHPDYTGDTYLAICRAIHKAVPEIHIHAFSPLEVRHGASTLGISVFEFLTELKASGLGSLPGTAAEILDDEIRGVICPDKLTTAQWVETIEAAHQAGLKTTSTIMYGHVESARHWARHLLRLRQLQQRTGGITEFVPLPFVAKEAPIYLKGLSRPGPTFSEAVLMHAVSRLALHPVIPCIQTSWVKMGPDGAAACLEAGANDLGGTLMNESITRAAGAEHGQEMPPEAMETLIRSLGRGAWQRTTLYNPAPRQQTRKSFGAPPLAAAINTPLRAGQGRPAAEMRRAVHETTQGLSS